MPIALPNIANVQVEMGYNITLPIETSTPFNFRIWVSDFWESSGTGSAYMDTPTGFTSLLYGPISTGVVNPIAGGTELGSVIGVSGITTVASTTLSVILYLSSVNYDFQTDTPPAGVLIPSKLTVYGLLINGSAPTFSLQNKTLTVLAGTTPP